ncbi:MAG TPA: hypothetical protein VEY50_05390 [Lysobacter sp.]|nr:hypothetical protein [Lysobacter sp.]
MSHRPPARRLLPSLALLALAGCAEQRAPEAPHAATPAPALALRAEPWPLPTADASAAQPDLIATADGRLLLSWIEGHGTTRHTLRLAAFDGSRWDAPRTIASGGDWFVNWADTPHIEATADGALWAHWLQKSAAGTYAYDVALTRSADGGRSWARPVTVNTDGTPTEHGFVALWPAARDRVGIAWLDGRHTGGGHDGHHGGGAMTLRTASFDAALARHDERELDASTCDCCQTDAAITARGPLLVYRDRADGEIRDIYAARLDPDGWTPARAVHADGWVMPACPVNGPAVDAAGTQAVVGWYTAAGGTPAVKLAHSADAGARFGAAHVLDQGEAVQGRVDVALDADAAWALWLREAPTGQSLWLARFTPDLRRELQRVELARPQGKGRGTGFAKLALRNGVPHVVWTELHAGAPRLRAAVVRTLPAQGSVAVR